MRPSDTIHRAPSTPRWGPRRFGRRAATAVPNARLLGAVLVVLLVAVVILGAGGCSKKSNTPTVEPKVKPPAVAEAGVLRAGIDLEYPPFGGVDKGKQAGIDVDVAQALAGDLGLKLRIVSVPASESLSALAEGSVDMVLSLPITSTTVASATVAGSYISDGPAFFTTVEETVTVDSIGSLAVAAQNGSEAFWALASVMGEDVIQAYPTLRGALGALADGKVDIVAGDAIVGAYIARDFPTIGFSGQLGTAKLLAVGVAKDNTDLADALRASLDKLASNGVLKTVRKKWVGDLPELQVPKS
jgi:polar amino acid transport system substrate-binding protein